MIQYQNKLRTKFALSVTSQKNDIIFQKYSRDVAMMTSSTQNQFF